MPLDTPSDIAAWYGTSAIIGPISMWLGNDMPYTPKYLAERIIQLNPFVPANNKYKIVKHFTFKILINTSLLTVVLLTLSVLL
ncbi:TetR-like C-terminal domain-containing protein [Paenibacillus sp. FSL F4-0125]|uniref:TetR-like C-terminal domain-containing protein n=1 Tax=Paenibacillus sp. FSL F4-0125 TaxID=2954730 RepID=UPI0030F60B75